MRTLIIKILLRLLGRPYYKPLSPGEVDSLLTRLATEEGFEKLPDFLQQCADQYRNQFLYSKDERFRGTVLAFVSLREQLLNHRPGYRESQMKLTKPKKSGKVHVEY
jgi:hypothetical protein